MVGLELTISFPNSINIVMFDIKKKKNYIALECVINWNLDNLILKLFT